MKFSVISVISGISGNSGESTWLPPDFLSLSLPFPPTELGILSLPHLLPLVLNRMFPWQPILLPGLPLPTDPHTGMTKESQPILNSLPTHTSSTVPTPSTSPILQESADSWSLSPIVSTCQFCGNKRMILTSPRIEPGLQQWELDVVTIMPPSSAAFQILQLINSHYHSLGL